MRRGSTAGRGRAIALATLAGVVVLVAFTAFALGLVQHAMRDQAQARVRSTAELTARLVSEQQLRFEEVVRAYAQRLDDLHRPRRARFPAADQAAARRALRDLVRGVEGLETAVLTDRKGRLVAAWPGPREPRHVDLSGREWFVALSKGGLSYTSRAYRSSAPGNRKITVAAVRIPGFAIVAAAEHGHTQAFVDGYGAARRMTLTVTDQAGVVVGRTRRATDLLFSRAADGEVAAALRGRSGARVHDDGVTGFAPVPRSGWTVTADVAASEAFADLGRLRVALVVAVAIVGFLLLWFVPLLAARLGRAHDALGLAEAFQRDLLPAELPPGVVRHYVASERRMLLGGDFLDAVEVDDGSLALLIGDVCGHGARAAALAARLRAGWRALAMAGMAVDGLRLLDRLVEDERPDEDLYATVGVAVLSPGRDRLRYALAGHPPMLLAAPRLGVVALEDARGPALGLAVGDHWPVGELDLPQDATLALYTDGLTEARVSRDAPRLGVAGLRALVADVVGADGAVDPAELLARIAALPSAADGFDDDVALLVAGGTRTTPDGDVAAEAGATTPR